MNDELTESDVTYEMKFDVATIKHLGLQMYSTLPSVIGELVANSWDANASRVEITIPTTSIDSETSEIVIVDNGEGMSDSDIQEKYLVIGRDRRDIEKCDTTLPPYNRKIMGRKGIGKFSAFGIAKEIVVESAKDEHVSRFEINYDDLIKRGDDRIITIPKLSSTEEVVKGTKIRLRHITKFVNRKISIDTLRRGLARRFAVIGLENNFEVIVNDDPISPEDRDFKRWLDKDTKGKPYLWEYDNEEIEENTGWTVSGWIGALRRTQQNLDGIERGIVLMARGKLVQEPFMFDAVIGQQFALSYFIGELNVDFVDEQEDTIGTTRNSLVWDVEANSALKKWGKKTVNKVARQWSQRRSADSKLELEQNPLYISFKERAKEIGESRILDIGDKLIRQAIEKNPTASPGQHEPLIQMCIDFAEFDTFWAIASDLTDTVVEDTDKLLRLFREWEIVEAKEMSKVTQGRIKTIEKLHHLIETNALEVPTLHRFLKDFPWVIDPRWTLVDDEVTYSDLLRNQFPEDETIPEENKRIDFLCVRDGNNLAVVEMKRGQSRLSFSDLEQIEKYVLFMKARVENTNDPELKYVDVMGYLLGGSLVNADDVRGKSEFLANSKIYIRQYTDLLSMVKRVHGKFLKRYNKLREAKKRAAEEK